jgi:PAS domain S-box-containing protein
LTLVTGPWDVFFVVDAKGNIVLSATEQKLSHSIEDYPHKAIAYHASMNGEIYYSDWVISKDTGWPTIIFSAPVRNTRDPAKPIVGVVVGNFSWPAVVEILSQTKLASLLFNKKGGLIASSHIAVPPKIIPSQLSVKKSQSLIVPAQKELFAEPMLTSVAVQSGYLSYKGSDWKLVLSNPTRVAFFPATESAIKVVLLLSIAFLLLAALILIFIAKFVVRPILTLTQATEQIAQGELTEKSVLIASRDEIGTLAASFNQMTANLKELHENQEKTIQERTHLLVEEKERLSVTLQSIGDAVITTNAQGKVVLMNSIAEQLTGWSQREAQGKPLTEVFYIVHEETRKECENPVDQVLRTQGVILLANHTMLISRSGKERIIEDSGAPIRFGEKGEIIGIILVFRDVTDRKKLQNLFLQADKMVAIGQLAGGIAHDLNNGLAPVIGYLDLLLAETKETTATQNLLLEAKKSANRCADVVKKLLSFSKPAVQAKATVSVNKILNELKVILRTVLPATIETVIEPSEEELWVKGNETELISVLVNLAINAKDAMGEGKGIFAIKVKNSHLEPLLVRQGFAAGDYAIVSISDTGSGMPPHILQRIFEPFFTTKPKGHGTGLGLSMVFSIIKEHSGWIDVSSHVGKGTTFQIYLPTTVEGEEAAATPQQPSDEISHLPGGNETILFVDDEEVMRNLGKVFLPRLGYRVLLGTNGEEALRIYEEKQSQIAAIICDMTMPQMTGRETIRRLRQINPNVKIIASSGHTDEGTEADLLADGASAFLQKPYTISKIAHLLRKVLG